MSRPPGWIAMNAGEFFEFSIAHDRKYSLDHLWLQLLDDKEEEMTVKIGISEFIRAEYGDIVRVVLTKPEDDSEFQIEIESHRISSKISPFFLYRRLRWRERAYF